MRVSQHLLQEIEERQRAKDEDLEGPVLQKYTFYLEERDFELLEEVKRQLRMMAPKGESRGEGDRPKSGHKRKRGFDLSALVRYALRHTYDDCV